MKIILDVDHIVREMRVSEEAFTKWKAANLEPFQEGGGGRWTALEELTLKSSNYSNDLKTG
ncbi:hypothetical protein [Gorillibacterium sp. sgz5001074]|uniref:hypothetical protein n=1 Tax=Gorillibacterium sp. sgz5001074 TaxID=3446695 RepID=UPI003F67438B